MTVPISCRADWLLPITSPPIPHGWVIIDDGRIREIGDGPSPAGVREANLGSCAVLPGLVNAHTHLELSWMRGRVAPAARMPDWIRALMALRRDVHRDDPLAMASAVGELRRAGTSLVGDVSNTLGSAHALGHSPIGGCLFYELLGFNDRDPARRVAEKVEQVRGATRQRVRTSIVPHATYSVSPALFRAIASHTVNEQWRVSIHLAESVDELEFLASGRGAFRELLEAVGAWTDDWRPPQTGPVAYIESFGLLTDRTLVVHAVQLTDTELRRIADAGATIVTCPRSNRWVGVGDPPISRFFASGARVAVGTDSLASCPDLNLFAELARIRELAPDIPTRRLLYSATEAGAQALGFGHEHGALEPGRRADLIAVEIPARTVDVEEYLCSGIRPDAVTWVGRPYV